MSFKLNSKIPNDNLAAFVIGILSVIPSLIPTALSVKTNPTYEMYRMADFETKTMILPIGFGLLHIILFFIMNKLFNPAMRTYWLLGFIIGLIYSFMGMMGDYAKKVYGIKSYWTLFLGGQCMYLLFYGIIVNYIFSNMSLNTGSSRF